MNEATHETLVFTIFHKNLLLRTIDPTRYCLSIVRTMSGALVRKFAYQARPISILVADLVQTQGFYRPLGTITNEVKGEAARKTEAAFDMPDMVPEHIKARAYQSYSISKLEHRPSGSRKPVITIYCSTSGLF